MTTTPDTRPLLDRALDQAGRLVVSTDPADGSLPTPCEDWDVTALTSHLLAVVHRIGAILDGADPAGLPRMIETADTDKQWQHERSATNAVLATDDVLDRVVVVPWGTVTGWQAIGSYAGELTTHTWTWPWRPVVPMSSMTPLQTPCYLACGSTSPRNEGSTFPSPPSWRSAPTGRRTSSSWPGKAATPTGNLPDPAAT